MEHFQPIHIANGEFKGPGIMDSSQEIHRADGDEGAWECGTDQ